MEGAPSSRWGGGLLVDALGEAAWLPAGVAVIAGDRGLWWTEDDGESWDLVEMSVSSLAVVGDRLYVGGDLGLWEGPHPTELEQGIEGHRILRVHGGPEAAVVLDAGGMLWWSEGGEWIPEQGPEGVLTAVVAAGQRLVGTAEGEILYQDGADWLPCGELPYLAKRDAVVRLASTDAGLLAATASRAPFFSSDACASWSDRSTGRDTEFASDVSGGAESDEVAFTVLQGQGDAWLVGGWAGLFLSLDAGESWDGPVLVPPDYTRAIAFPDPWDGRTVFVGANSAGVLCSLDRGRSFTAPSHGLGSPNVQRIYPVPGAPERLWAVAGHVLYLSSDGGISWQLMQTPFSTAAAMLVQDPLVWLIGSDRGGFGHVVAVSPDSGLGWDPATGITEVFGGATPVGMFEVSPHGVCASGSSRSMLACGPGPEGPFEVLYQGSVSGGVPALSWPPGEAERLLVVDAAGIHLTEDDGQSWQTVLEAGSDVATVSAAATDGSLWIATAGGRVWRSLDGGMVWEQLDVPLPSTSRVLAPMPDIGEGGGVLVGTAGGVFEVVDPLDDAPWLRRWGDHQWLDASSAYTTCPYCTDSAVQIHGVPSETASLDWMVELPADSRLKWTLRGREITLVGETDGSTGVV